VKPIGTSFAASVRILSACGQGTRREPSRSRSNEPEEEEEKKKRVQTGFNPFFHSNRHVFARFQASKPGKLAHTSKISVCTFCSLMPLMPTRALRVA
jgi:hypothetical protein